MEFLQGAECAHHVFLVGEGFGAEAEFLLGFEVLLEIEVAELLVDLHVVIEHFHVVLVRVVEIFHAGLRHGADGAPAVLDLAELGEGLLEVFAGLDQGLEVFDDGKFLLVVLFLVLFLLLREGGATGFILAVKILESALDLGERIEGDRFFGGFFRSGFLAGGGRLGGGRLGGLHHARGDLFLAQVLVERRFQRFGVLVELLHVFAFEQFLEGIHDFLQAQVRKIIFGGLLCGIGFGNRFGGLFDGGFDSCSFLDFYGLLLSGNNRVKIFTHCFTVFM